jgi:hypothetical protein
MHPYNVISSRSRFVDNERTAVRSILASSGMLVQGHDGRRQSEWTSGSWDAFDAVGNTSIAGQVLTSARVRFGMGLIRLGTWLRGSVPADLATTDRPLPV